MSYFPSPGKPEMELVLAFSQGSMTGSGRDRIGEFTIEGGYQISDGKCVWVKQYVGKHAVGYRGFNEGICAENNVDMFHQGDLKLIPRADKPDF